MKLNYYLYMNFVIQNLLYNDNVFLTKSDMFLFVVRGFEN